MSLSAQLMIEIKAVVGQGAQLLQVQDGLRTVKCDLVQCELLAATLTELTLETTELAGVSMAQLEQASRDLTARVTYLLEPIAPIEIDADSCTVQMRSNPPQQDDNGCRYYELLLRRGGSASLCRYEKQPGQPRVSVPAVLTHEVVGRLIGDFERTVDSL